MDLHPPRFDWVEWVLAALEGTEGVEEVEEVSAHRSLSRQARGDYGLLRLWEYEKVRLSGGGVCYEVVGTPVLEEEMSCDFNGRDELRAALIRSTILLQTALSLARGPEERKVLSERVEENKRVLKGEAFPQYCPECTGEHNNPRFMVSGQSGGGSVEGRTCVNPFHNPREAKSIQHL